jgi:DNA/RNA endonuclease YhcR with UshA esterase domain
LKSGRVNANTCFMPTRRAFALIAFIATSLVAFAEPTKPADKPLAAAEAKNHIGEMLTVIGHVDGVKTTQSGMVLLNLDGHFPNQALTVVVRPKDTAAVGDVSGFAGKTIKVTGRVTEYHGGAQIEISDKAAIEEVKPAK